MATYMFHIYIYTLSFWTASSRGTKNDGKILSVDFSFNDESKNLKASTVIAVPLAILNQKIHIETYLESFEEW